MSMNLRRNGSKILHLGDITKLNGKELQPVDVIIGGSPCQDLSIAGSRKGLGGERSSLFMEQIRIIKEMHNEYGTTYPRYMLWENVPGAFSSNKGDDFRTVLEKTSGIICRDAFIPRPPKGKWRKSGCILADRWSVAWRVFDSQFWGVPQRRKRIALIADFRGRSAPEILFVRKSLSGNIKPQQEERKKASNGVRGNPDKTVWCFQSNGINRTDKSGCSGKGWRENVCYTLTTEKGHAIAYLYEDHGIGSRYNGSLNIVSTVIKNCKTGEGNAPLTASYKSFGQYAISETGKPLLACDDITTSDLVLKNGTVRRLTPLECERLQGFPDGWTDIGEWTDSKGKKRKSSDSVRYRALGNSIALPPWKWILKRISAQYEKDALLGSLFDGIGGFPYLWEKINGRGSAVWASEIEEFCMAVTRKRIG